MAPTETAPTEVGVRAVQLARSTLELVLGPNPPADPATPFRRLALPTMFDEPHGVFTTLKQSGSGLLRGCIGYPQPVFPLRVGVPRTAAGAALEDPRFPPMDFAELSRVTVEVSVLTVPEPLPARVPADRPTAVRVGRDGLIVRWRQVDGLLLPQVAVEQHWTAEEFLAETCAKAGLPREAWRRPEAQFLRFASSVFVEETPGGAVQSVRLEA